MPYIALRCSSMFKRWAGVWREITSWQQLRMWRANPRCWPAKPCGSSLPWLMALHSKAQNPVFVMLDAAPGNFFFCTVRCAGFIRNEIESVAEEPFMQMRSNTILIAGERFRHWPGLAEAFHKLGNQVVVAGRRAELLRQVCSANPGMSHVVLDVTNPESLRSVVGQVTARFPELNCVIANAGVQRVHNFDRDEPVDDRAIESRKSQPTCSG